MAIYNNNGQYGLFSLQDTPENVLNSGYGEKYYRQSGAFDQADRDQAYRDVKYPKRDVEGNVIEPDFAEGYGAGTGRIDYDPAFGELSSLRRFQPAPYTGQRPFANLVDLPSDNNQFYNMPPSLERILDRNTSYNRFELNEPTQVENNQYNVNENAMQLMQNAFNQRQIMADETSVGNYPTEPQIASPRTVIDQNRIPGRIQKSVEPSTRFRDYSDMNSFLKANPDMGQNIKEKIGSVFNQGKQGILNNKLVKGAGTAFNFLTGNIPGMLLGLAGLDTADYQKYDPNVDYSKFNPNIEINDFYDPRTKTNRFQRAKPGSFASFRTGAEYFKARREKKAAAKAQQEQIAREASTAARARAANASVYANAGVGSGGFASQNTGSNSNFSNKSGRGRTGYQEGGLASMFTRRR